MKSPVSLPETPPPAVIEALEQLRHAGAVNGIALGRSSTLLLNWLPYTRDRAQTTLAIIHELTLLLRKHDRDPRLLHFRLENGGIIAAVLGQLRLILLHADPREAPVIGAAASAMLADIDQLWRDPPIPRKTAKPSPPQSEPLDETVLPRPETPVVSIKPIAKTVPIVPEPSDQLGRIIHPDRTHTWFRGAPQHRAADTQVAVKPGPDPSGR